MSTDAPTAVEIEGRPYVQFKDGAVIECQTTMQAEALAHAWKVLPFTPHRPAEEARSRYRTGFADGAEWGAPTIEPLPDNADTDAIARRVLAAIHSADVSRSEISIAWPECHKTKCQHRHETPDHAFAMMKHQIGESVRSELRWRNTTTVPAELGDTPYDHAVYTLAVLLARYNVRDASTWANAAHLMIDAHPALIAALNTETTTACAVCGDRGEYITSPGGDWWAHQVHPDDHHDYQPVIFSDGVPTRPDPVDVQAASDDTARRLHAQAATFAANRVHGASEFAEDTRRLVADAYIEAARDIAERAAREAHRAHLAAESADDVAARIRALATPAGAATEVLDHA